MASFKIYEKKDKVTKKGVPLVFVIYHSGKTYKLSTGLHCKPYAWNQVGQRADGKRDADAAKINNKLRKAEIALAELLESDFDIEKIRQAFNPTEPTEQAVEVKPELLEKYNQCTEEGKKFFQVIESLISDHKNDWSEGYQKRFRSLRTKLLKFEPNFKPSLLTEKFWLRFVDFCIEGDEKRKQRGNVSNTINTDSKTLVTLIKELRKEGYNFEKGLEKKLAWRYKEPGVLGLSWDKVLKVASLDLSDYPSATIEYSQILWLIGAFTGRRWTEVCGMTESNFYQRKGQWRYRNIGKGQVSVDMPLFKEAVDFLKKIKFKIPKLTGQTVNLDIKAICQKAGFKDEIQIITPISKNRVDKKLVKEYKTVTFHTGRHSYGRHVAELASSMPHADKFISFMLGHASPQTSWKYRNMVESSYDKMFDELKV